MKPGDLCIVYSDPPFSFYEKGDIGKIIEEPTSQVYVTYFITGKASGKKWYGNSSWINGYVTSLHKFLAGVDDENA